MFCAICFPARAAGCLAVLVFVMPWARSYGGNRKILLPPKVNRIAAGFHLTSSEFFRSTVTEWNGFANKQMSDAMWSDLERLMVRYQQADRVAATALIELLSPQLLHFFAGELGSRDDAEDMLQEAWLRIHRVRHTYRPGEPLLPWVYAIARRVRVDDYRKRRRKSREMGMDVLPEPPVRYEPPAEGPAFQELVASLPDSQKEVLTLLKVDGLTVEEVAKVTASTAGAVKQRAHRAYERLRTLLQGANR